MHRQFDFMVEERYEYGVRQKVPHLKGSIIFITFFLSCYGFHLLFWDTKPDMVSITFLFVILGKREIHHVKI